MALLFPPGFRVADADGNPLSGAKVRVYIANTTTPASLFNDSGMAAPSAISNPVITDAAGYPANGGNECAIYCASGTYDVAFLDSSNNVLASFDDFSPLAGDAGDISRTVSGNARLFITGSGGGVLIQAGPPTGTDIGGDLTLEGWAATQLDTATIDAADTAFTGDVGIVGDLTVGGELVPGVVDSGTATAVSSLAIALTGGHHSYTIELYDIAPSAASSLRTTVSIDNGSNYVAAAAYTSYANLYDGTALSNVGAAYWYGTVGNMSNTAGKAQTIAVDFDTVLSGTGDSSMVGRIVAGDVGYIMWGVVAAGGRVTNVKVAAVSGTFTCKWRLRQRGG